LSPFSITRTFENTPLLQALNNVFYEHELTYSLFQDDGIVVFRKSMDVRSKFDEQSQMLVIGDPLNVGRYKTATLKGRILDGKTGEPLTGAVVFNNKTEKGTTTNSNGEFEFVLPTGDHQLQFSFVGFENSYPKIRLIENGAADFQLFEESHRIGEVTVLGLQTDLPKAQMSMVQMTSAEIKNACING
jgi:hypothetical protein